MHTSNAAINSAIYKTNFKDALLSNLISKATDNAYKAVGSYSSINSNSLFKESGLGKIALHSAVGVLSTKVFANLRLDIDKNEVVLDASKAKDREALKRIYYSINKEILNEFDKNHFVDTSSVKTSSTNANFSQQRSNAITKQTILSSITANNLNVEVGNNTHLKGSLLAAGEYDKDNTFIDNHNLNLKTNTLSYENLSNTSYTKETNFSIGANYAFKDTKTDNQAKADNKDLNSKITSASYSNQRNLSYTLSKNLATLGNGNIEIADKENSDDLDRLNRDTTKLTKDLVNTSVSSNVDASIDARVLTADGREQIKQDIKYTVDRLDDFNRFVKDKISDELTNEQKEQIEQVGLENSLLQALRKEGVSDEKINLLLNDESVRRLISAYNNKHSLGIKDGARSTNNQNTYRRNDNHIELTLVEVAPQKNFQDHLVDGAEAINSIVKIVGEKNAASAILITQFATQGIVKTSMSLLGDETKDALFGGVKDKISNYISKDLFEVNDKGWQDKQKQAIYSLSDVSADFSIDLAISGPFALMKGAKNLGKVNKKFDESLKENNVNSDTIVNSNAELKRNEHSLNNKNGSDWVAANKTGKAALDRVSKKSSEVTSDITKIDKPTIEVVKDKDSATNVALYEKYKKELYFSETFNSDGTLTENAIKASKTIKSSSGDKIGNKKLIAELSKRGDIKDWVKAKVKVGKDEVHFYKNLKTNGVYYEMDYKTKFGGKK